MSSRVFELTRVWAAVTGLILVAWYFGRAYLEMAPPGMLPVLITAIGGFELYFFGQDLKRRRRGRG